VRDEFDLSASAKSVASSGPMLLPVLNENENEWLLLLQRSSDRRVEFDLSASDNLVAPLPIQLPVLNEENEMKQQDVTAEIEWS
jgi:hypothetical protein